MSDADRPPVDTTPLDGDDVVTVASLNDEIATLVEGNPATDHEFVVGDISDCDEANSNVHFDLVYDDASIHCVLFGYRRGGASVEPEEGMQVAVSGDLSYYEQRGSCSILVSDVVDMGEGAYSQIYEENRTTLAEDGLLDDENRETLPELPGTIGLVTSADSDARTDAVTALHNRYPDLDVVLKDATVQGSDAQQELMSAISALDDDARVDVIIVTRGGGADKTLRVFNETPLCRVIAGTDTPSVVGIGHEDDHTLAEDVADKRVMTPTHVGDIVPERAALEDEFEELAARLDTAYDAAVDQQVTAYATALDNAYRTTVTTELRDLEARLDHATQRCIDTQLSDLEARLTTAYTVFEQEQEHEAELEKTVETVRAETEQQVQQKVSTMQRRYRVALVVLVVLLLALAVLYVLQP